MVRTANGGRQQLTSLLEQATEFSTEACDIIIKACSDSDVSKHGPALWALMDTEGSPATISGLKLFVYLQYYFCGMVYAKKKAPVGRYLSDADLGYLVAVAAHGVQEGCKVFDNAFAVGDLGLLHALQVTEQQFKDFFYNPTPAFTMANVVSIVQKFLPIWSGHPNAFIAFITPEITSYYLTKQGSGSFFIRFNSSGGISAVLLDAQLQIQSHQFDLSIVNSPIAFIALLQRSTTLQKFGHLSEEPSLPKADILTALKTFAQIKEVDITNEIQKQQGSAVPASKATITTVFKAISTPPAGIASSASPSKPGNTSLGPKDAPQKLIANPTASSAPNATVASENASQAASKAVKAPEAKKKEEAPSKKVAEPEPKEKSGKRASEADNSEKAAKKVKKSEPEEDEDEDGSEDNSGDDGSEEYDEDDSVDYDDEEEDENYEDDGDSEDEEIDEDDE